MPPTPDYAGAISYALSRLGAELPAMFVYHNLWHTQHDVMPAVIRLARLNELPEADSRLLEVAAAFHDIGYTESADDHEQRGVRLAGEVLPGYGFEPEAIQRVAGMILATRMPQSPQSLPEAVLADSDLDVLGRDDFMERSEDLRQELAALGQAISDEEWRARQVALLERHVYFTRPARVLRAAGQQANLARFRAQFREDSQAQA